MSGAPARPHVVVIGGGLAGMAAALGAADGGARVTLVEKRAKLGGLTWSFQRRGLTFDNGQHVFLRCCTAYQSFLDRIGAAGQVHLQRRLDVPVLSPAGAAGAPKRPGRRRPSAATRVAHIARTALPAPLHLGGSLARYSHLSAAERLRLGRPVLALRRLDLADPSLDTEAFGPWLRRHGQSRRAIERLWDLVVLPTVNVGAEEASLSMAATVFRIGLLDRSDAGDIGWSNVPLGRLHGDNGAAALARVGVDTLLTTTCTSLHTPERAGGGLRVTAGNRSLEADAVICALPHDGAAALLPPGVLGDVSGLGASPIVNVHLVLDRRVTDLPFAAAVGSPVQFVFDRTESAGVDPTSGHQCLVVSLSAADRWIGERPEELVRTFHAALGDLFPAARHSKLVDGVVTRERAATWRAVPGTAALRPGAATSVPGLFLAGAWCDTGWPATMEGAVRSGTSAAAAALDHLWDPSRPAGTAGVGSRALDPPAAAAAPLDSTAVGAAGGDANAVDVLTDPDGRRLEGVHG